MELKAMMKERWSENRILCADLVEVCWSDKTGQSCTAIANLEEMSVNRAHLVLDAAVPSGATLRLHMAQGDITARVRDCRHEPDFGFALVIQLPKKCRWKSQLRHIFNPRGLERRESARNRTLCGGTLDAQRD
jgi:hypothetical protein